MDCDICLNPYDHSKHKPFSLTCPHTVCLDCLNKLNTKYCPSCKDPIKAKYPNLALIKLIPESQYDKLRHQLEKTLIEASDSKQKLNKDCEHKLSMGLNKLKSLREEINNKTAEIINLILKNQKKLIEEANILENGLQFSLRKLRMDSQMEMKINEAKVCLERNVLNETELSDLNADIDKIKDVINKMVCEVDKLDESYEFNIFKSICIEAGIFGEIESKKKTFDEYLHMAEDFNVQENYKGAVFFYDKAIQIDPNHAETHNLKGNALFKMKEYKKALDCYDKAIDLKPEESIFYCNKANSLTNMEGYRESILFFNKAIELDPNYYLAYRQKGIALQNLKEYDESINCFDKAIEINPCFPSVYNLKGLALYCMKEYQQAIDNYTKAIELDPKDCVFYFNKGESLRYLKEHDQSIECLNKAIELNPHYAMAYSSKGQTLIELKHFQEAVEAYDKAIAIEPQNMIYVTNKSAAIKQQKVEKTGKITKTCHSSVENIEPRLKRKRYI